MNSHSLMERLRNYGQQMANEYGLYISAMSDLESYSYDTAMFHRENLMDLSKGLSFQVLIMIYILPTVKKQAKMRQRKLKLWVSISLLIGKFSNTWQRNKTKLGTKLFILKSFFNSQWKMKNDFQKAFSIVNFFTQ